MIVTVKPRNREEYALTLSGIPEFSSSQGIGYEAATIPCELRDDQREEVLGGTLRIHGHSGIVWQGIVLRRPGLGEPLTAQGWGWCGTLGRRKARYADKKFLSDLREWNGQNWGAFSRSTTDGIIKIAQSPGTTIRQGDGAGYAINFDAQPEKITFTCGVGTSDIGLRIYPMDVNGAAFDTPYSNTTPGTATGQTFTFPAGTYGMFVYAWKHTAGTRTATDSTGDAGIYDCTLYGVDGFTSATTATLLADILTTEISTTYLPAGSQYLAFLESDTTAFDSITFDSSTANEKIEEIGKHSAYDFGWYTELVGGLPYCVPHWTARNTSPSLVIALTEAESYDLDESSLDELVSVVRVAYQDVSRNDKYVDVTDTDTSHPLVQLGITRYGDLSASTASSTTATSLGQLYLADKGRRQVKGTVSTRVVRSASGSALYLPDVRPGQAVYLTGLSDGAVACVVKRVTLTGDALADIELDNSPYRLDIALARLAG